MDEKTWHGFFVNKNTSLAMARGLCIKRRWINECSTGYLVKSSETGTEYQVSFGGQCNCLSFHHRNVCKHQAAIALTYAKNHPFALVWTSN